MKNLWSAVLASLVLVGCPGRTQLDTSALSITPGVGISNLLELRMTPKEIARATGDLDARSLGVGVWAYQVPSLGAEWEQETKDQSPPGVYFLVVRDLVVVPGRRPLERFQGKVDGGLSFKTEGAVTWSDVMAKFGKPQHIMKDGSGTQQRIEMTEWIRKGEPYAIFDQARGCGTVFYPGKGILFGFESNTVRTVNVYRPYKGGAEK